MRNVKLLEDSEIDGIWNSIHGQSHLKNNPTSWDIMSKFNIKIPIDILNVNKFDVAKAYALHTNNLKKIPKKQIINRIKLIIDDIENLYLQKNYACYEYYYSEEPISTFSKAKNNPTSSEEMTSLQLLNNKLIHYVKTKQYHLMLNAIVLTLNDLKEFKSCSYHVLRRFAILISPVFPYTSERMWNTMLSKRSIFYEEYPNGDKSIYQFTNYPVYINGKKKLTFKTFNSLDDNTASDIFLCSTALSDALNGREIQVFKFIRDKCYALITKDYSYDQEVYV